MDYTKLGTDISRLCIVLFFALVFSPATPYPKLLTKMLSRNIGKVALLIIYGIALSFPINKEKIVSVLIASVVALLLFNLLELW